MIKLETSKVTKVVADNIPKTQRGVRLVDKAFVDVRISTNKLVATLVQGEVRRTFAGAYTAKGWRPLPAMAVLSGKKLYTDAEAAEAVAALFGAVP